MPTWKPSFTVSNCRIGFVLGRFHLFGSHNMVLLKANPDMSTWNLRRILLFSLVFQPITALPLQTGPSKTALFLLCASMATGHVPNRLILEINQIRITYMINNILPLNQIKTTHTSAYWSKMLLPMSTYGLTKFQFRTSRYSLFLPIFYQKCFKTEKRSATWHGNDSRREEQAMTSIIKKNYWLCPINWIC